MIGEPFNDRACLAEVTKVIRERTNAPEIAAIARRFSTLDQLAAWIVTLAQREDKNDLVDGPKVACDVLQRLRVPAPDGNCVEKSALFVAAGHRIDPSAHFQLATINTEQGRHTFPVVNGRPVVLHPTTPRNALTAGLDLIGEAATGHPRSLTLSEALGWALTIAEAPAEEYADGAEVLAHAEATAGALFVGEVIDREGLGALLWVLALAEREQVRWWPARAGAIRRVVELLAERVPSLLVELDPDCGCGPDEDAADGAGPRNGWHLEWVGPARFVRAVERVAEPVLRIARPLVKPAIKATLASYGVPPELVDVADRGLDEIRAGNRARVARAAANHVRATTYHAGQRPDGTEAA